MAAGRPTKYKEEYCDLIIDHMKNGYPIDTFGPLVGVHRSTIYEWEKQFPEFSDAIKKGRDLSLKWWIDRGRAGMMKAAMTPDGKPQKIEFNATVWIFMMKNLHHWKDVHKLEHSGAVKYSSLSEEEIAERIKDALDFLKDD